MATLTRPSYLERLLIIGSNGSGKSNFTKYLLAKGGYPRWVAIDSKGDFDPPTDYMLITEPDSWKWKVAKGGIVYRPKPEFNNGPWLDEILRRLYIRATKEGKKKPFVVYIDEALFLAKTNHTQWLAALAVSGRSLNVGLWVSSQRPKWIPVEVRSEAWRWVIYYLSYESDMKEVAAYSSGRLTVEELQESLVDHSFWQISRGAGGRKDIHRYPPVPLLEEEE